MSPDYCQRILPYRLYLLAAHLREYDQLEHTAHRLNADFPHRGDQAHEAAEHADRLRRAKGDHDWTELT